MTAREILLDARSILADRTQWCRGSLAKDANGYHCEPQTPQARQWCAIGAMYAYKDDREAWDLLQDCAHDLYGMALSVVNDDLEHGHAAVLSVYDYAIASLP